MTIFDTRDTESLNILRDWIEYPRLWRLDVVEKCQTLLTALQYYHVQEASTIITLVKHFEATGATIANAPCTRVPTIADYPPRVELLRCCRRVIHGLGLLALSNEFSVVQESLGAIWLIYNLDELRWHAHGHEVWVNSNSNKREGWSAFLPMLSAFGPFEARQGRHIARALEGVDDVVEFHFHRWMNGGRFDAGMGSGIHRAVMESIANMCLRIMSKFAEQQSVSGQTRTEFFDELRRDRNNAYQWLAFVYAVIHEEMKTEGMNKFDALRIAERVTSPLDGALMQGKYIVSVFRRKQISGIQWSRKPAEVRFAMRPPGEIWKKFKTSCVWCLAETNRTCSSCHRVRYCGDDCQRAHWRRSHRTACSIYALIPLALTLKPANDED